MGLSLSRCTGLTKRLPPAFPSWFARSMARVRSIARKAQDARLHPTEVDATYQVLRTPAGALFQLSTYGSDARASEPKVSQTIQFDETAARALLGALREAFPTL
ncbi:hypothetical protein AFE02nite_22450 [Actinotalea fermentans]|uniref:Methionyl-tRNA formyltransferase n=1 Tax=Actinotalea fermentans TaxID=43671 RepID=A0A511YZ87_9CELL|nr:hypothetical protein AFE02nite_22450 [Actinotalea fermentans]